LLSTICIFSSCGKGLSSIHATVAVLRLEVEAEVSGVGDGDCHIGDARELDSRHLPIDMYSRTTLESLPISDASLIGTPPCLPTSRPSRDGGCGCLKLLTRTPRFRFRSHENKEIDRVDRLSFHQSLKQSRCQPDGCQSVLMTSRALPREFTRSSISDYYRTGWI
jgi:hypothetical protein